MTDVINSPRPRQCEPDAPSGPSSPHIPGEPGIWIVLFGDLTMFTVIFVVYLHERGKAPSLFADSQAALNSTFGAINTLVLLTSSLLVVLATRAMQRENLRRWAPRLTIGAFAVGALFVLIKVIEYREKVIAGITPTTNEFFMYYFVLTGLHLAHVLLGLAVLTVLWLLARRPAHTKTQIAYFEGGACFWHMVDLLWIVIFPLLFLVR
ncbi:cytochrome c oxidase subunit 3 [Mycolicibacterium holsaticum]|uniref:Probable cytochrome c oxidase subunit 3 n=1 Tax=Mycolicibacterium holsaticum TaxID=152142 RepID=A0A1E3S4B9_9MYCO|nr:cytochrome c oxidase subunit 3 [Mycolicibacterium holsaticum]ODQ96447.1 cytochrome C oxidase subunit III [Mycolicibacterium holsaticum]